jgi:hypothetical protein
MKSKIKFIIIFSLFISFITYSSSVEASSSTENTIRLFKNKKLEKKNNKIVYRKFLSTSIPYIGADKVHALSVTGKGTGNVLGLTEMSGTASAAPAGICDNFDAKGSIGGGGNTINVSFDTSACTDMASPPAFLICATTSSAALALAV